MGSQFTHPNGIDRGANPALIVSIKEVVMDATGLIVSLLSGAVGGNLAGALLKGKSLGTLGNSIVGILGGGLGSSILGALGTSTTGILGSIAGGTVGGAVLLLIIGLLKGMFAKAA
jgi:uncharacterized membrane protein YeaQ/YmgE (transglycosylase-associated protein family)